jgi:hypothetical protein
MRTRTYGGVAGEGGRPLPLCRFSADFFRTGPVSSGDVESSAGGLCVGWPVAGGRARAAGLELLQLLLEGGKAVGALERMLDCSAADSEFHTCEISFVCWPTLW